MKLGAIILQLITSASLAAALSLDDGIGTLLVDPNIERRHYVPTGSNESIIERRAGKPPAAKGPSSSSGASPKKSQSTGSDKKAVQSLKTSQTTKSARTSKADRIGQASNGLEPGRLRRSRQSLTDGRTSNPGQISKDRETKKGSHAVRKSRTTTQKPSSDGCGPGKIRRRGLCASKSSHKRGRSASRDEFYEVRSSSRSPPRAFRKSNNAKGTFQLEGPGSSQVQFSSGERKHQEVKAGERKTVYAADKKRLKSTTVSEAGGQHFGSTSGRGIETKVRGDMDAEARLETAGKVKSMKGPGVLRTDDAVPTTETPRSSIDFKGKGNLIHTTTTHARR